MSFQEMKKKTKFWFKYMQVKLWCKRDYKYHCVFRYRDDISPSVERSRKDVRHCKSILKRKLFGRGKFDLDWFDVNETTDWNKNKKEIHVHILVGELPKNTRPINKPFPELLIDSWCKLDTSAQREYQFVGVTNNDKDDYEDVSYLLKSMKGNNSRYDDKFEWLDVENISRQVS